MRGLAAALCCAMLASCARIGEGAAESADPAAGQADIVDDVPPREGYEGVLELDYPAVANYGGWTFRDVAAPELDLPIYRNVRSTSGTEYAVTATGLGFDIEAIAEALRGDGDTAAAYDLETSLEEEFVDPDPRLGGKDVPAGRIVRRCVEGRPEGSGASRGGFRITTTERTWAFDGPDEIGARFILNDLTPSSQDEARRILSLAFGEDIASYWVDSMEGTGAVVSASSLGAGDFIMEVESGDCKYIFSRRIAPLDASAGRAGSYDASFAAYCSETGRTAPLRGFANGYEPAYADSPASLRAITGQESLADYDPDSPGRAFDRYFLKHARAYGGYMSSSVQTMAYTESEREDGSKSYSGRIDVLGQGLDASKEYKRLDISWHASAEPYGAISSLGLSISGQTTSVRTDGALGDDERALLKDRARDAARYFFPDLRLTYAESPDAEGGTMWRDASAVAAGMERTGALRISFTEDGDEAWAEWSLVLEDVE